MAEVNKHRHSKDDSLAGQDDDGSSSTAPAGGGRRASASARRSRGTRFARLRTPVGAGVAGVVVVVVLALIAVVVLKDDDPAPKDKPITLGKTTFGGEWETKDGNHYRITATPIATDIDNGTESGCIAAPPLGRTNIRFTIKIENLSDKPARVPDVEIGTNVDGSGVVKKSASFTTSQEDIEVLPRPNAETCTHTATISAAGRKRIAGNGSIDLDGVLGGVRTPVDGLNLILRYTEASSSEPSGEKAGEVVVQFPDTPAS